MFAVLNLGNFDIYVDKGEILGSFDENIPEKFENYVEKLAKHPKVKKSNKPFIALYTLEKNHQFRRRFVLNNYAVNPVTEYYEVVPHGVFVYPETKYYEKTPNYTMSYGLRVEIKRLIFFPLVTIRSLTEQEQAALQKWAPKIHHLTLNEHYLLLNDINVELLNQWNLSGDRVGLRLRDNDLQKSYCVLINTSAKFLSTNVCVSPGERVYLVELILIIREHGHPHIYSESSYEWIVN